MHISRLAELIKLFLEHFKKELCDSLFFLKYFHPSSFSVSDLFSLLSGTPVLIDNLVNVEKHQNSSHLFQAPDVVHVAS